MKKDCNNWRRFRIFEKGKRSKYLFSYFNLSNSKITPECRLLLQENNLRLPTGTQAFYNIMANEVTTQYKFSNQLKYKA